jgi:copper transport protein
MIDAVTGRVRFSLKCAVALACCTLAFPITANGAGRALFHAALLHSTPAANSHLKHAPDSLRLVFSEGVVSSLSQVSLTGPDGQTVVLRVENDPHDVHALVSVIDAASPGRYQVVWHVVSADGHPVGGTFEFTVDTGNQAIAKIPAAGVATQNGSDTTAIAAPAQAPAAATTENASTPVVASILRGVGLGAMMAGLGLLFFGTSARTGQPLKPGSLPTNLIAFGSVLLVAHLLSWVRNISPTGGFDSSFVGSVFGSTPGRAELLRVALALLTLWAVALARRSSLALILGAACLIVSGAIGHPAGIEPLWTVPSKAIHLLSGSAWLGGLLWLLTGARREDVDFPAEARRVSRIALISVALVLLSGIIQIRFFLQQPSDLIHSDYGRLVSLKIIGLLVLIGLGAFNRYLVLPAIDDSAARPALSRTVRQEIAIMVALIVIGGFLAYVPTPSSPADRATTAMDGVQ